MVASGAGGEAGSTNPGPRVPTAVGFACGSEVVAGTAAADQHGRRDCHEQSAGAPGSRAQGIVLRGGGQSRALLTEIVAVVDAGAVLPLRGYGRRVAVGIIGSGRIGATVARLLVAAGYEVGIANSRGPDSLGELVAELGGRARASTVAEAASAGELILVAIPLHAIDQLPGEAFAGRVAIDANNYYAGRDGTIAELEDDRTTSSELLAAQLPGAHVIKAFNTLTSATLGSGGRPDTPLDERLAIALAGDDAGAKQRVTELIERLGFAPLDTGSLAEGGRLQQPGALFFNRPMTLAEATHALSTGRG